jgi:hypothetical protein
VHRNNLGSGVNWTLVHLQEANGSLRPEFKDKLALHPIGEQEARTKPVRQEGKKLPVNIGTGRYVLTDVQGGTE